MWKGRSLYLSRQNFKAARAENSAHVLSSLLSSENWRPQFRISTRPVSHSPATPHLSLLKSCILDWQPDPALSLLDLSWILMDRMLIKHLNDEA